MNKLKSIRFILIGLLIVILIYLFKVPLWENIQKGYLLLTDRQRVEKMISSFPLAGPFIFIGLQILQVIFAPVPGEATGFIGGYIFGVIPGFCYSSVGLTIGSWINFSLGRLLGRRYVSILIPSEYLQKFDRSLERQGLIIIFILFIFPGFPKDYMCIFLGLSNMPIKWFLLASSIGRMPGTFLLSMQGASIYDSNYTTFVILMLILAIVSLLAYFFKDSFYQWIETKNTKKTDISKKTGVPKIKEL